MGTQMTVVIVIIITNTIPLSQWELRLGGCQKLPAEIRAARDAQWSHLEGFLSHSHVFG